VGAATANTRNGQQVSVYRALRTCGSVVIQKGVEVSRLSGTESVMGQRGKLEFYALLNRKPIKTIMFSMFGQTGDPQKGSPQRPHQSVGQ